MRPSQNAVTLQYPKLRLSVEGTPRLGLKEYERTCKDLYRVLKVVSKANAAAAKILRQHGLEISLAVDIAPEGNSTSTVG